MKCIYKAMTETKGPRTVRRTSEANIHAVIELMSSLAQGTNDHYGVIVGHGNHANDTNNIAY